MQADDESNIQLFTGNFIVTNKTLFYISQSNMQSVETDHHLNLLWSGHFPGGPVAKTL